ncbi:MAG: hypothetical protein HOA30_04120 [Rhodospirillaceae bacterium]|jgi:hypothetical protein|nr:hypothetical protein [Rhodospirillaceae bacterium]MBT7249332.1 hypothetical protein [Rhodospirillaceae bacterium]
MTLNAPQSRTNNHAYQRQLAESMVVKSLGVERAIGTCLENGWTGTLNMILRIAS